MDTNKWIYTIPSSRLSNLAKCNVNNMRKAIKLYEFPGLPKKLFYVVDMQALVFIY